MSGLTKEFIADQTRRFSRLHGWPEDHAGQTELLNALWRHAESNEHAEKIVTKTLETSKFCPTIAHISEAAAHVLEQINSAKRPEFVEYDPLWKRATICPKCHGTGFWSVNRGGRKAGAQGDVIVGGEWFAAVCPCRKQGAA